MNRIKLSTCTYTCTNSCSVELDALYLCLVNAPQIIIKQNPDSIRIMKQSIYKLLTDQPIYSRAPEFEYQKKPLIARITNQQEIILITPKSY